MAFFISQDIIYDYVDFDGELVNVVKQFCLDGTTRIKQQLARLIKPSESKQPDYKILQRDMKAYGQKELVYDVYCDRVNFIGVESFSAYVTFFNNRGIIFNRDRAGYSIDIKDAQKIGLPVEFSTYRLLPDSRKKPIVMNTAKVTLLDELLTKPKPQTDDDNVVILSELPQHQVRMPIEIIEGQETLVIRELWEAYGKSRMGSKEGKYKIKGYGYSKDFNACYLVSDHRDSRMYCFDFYYGFWSSNKEHAYTEALKHGSVMRIG